MSETTSKTAQAVSDGIQIGVAAALAAMEPRTEKAKEQTVPHTSIDQYVQSDATVRFRRWGQFGGTGYLRGQEAGFTAAEANTIVRAGLGDIVHTRAGLMVTK